jgi:hypothetical protein
MNYVSMGEAGGGRAPPSNGKVFIFDSGDGLTETPLTPPKISLPPCLLLKLLLRYVPADIVRCCIVCYKVSRLYPAWVE